MKLNRLNEDRSVSSFSETHEPGHGYTVPFGIKNFRSQIEEDIYPAVELLNVLGYPTVTSCHGHSFYNYLFNNAIRFNLLGPGITVKIDSDKTNYFRTHMLTWLITTEVKNYEEYGDHISSSFSYIRIKIRPIISLFFTNKYLCQQILKTCNKLK
jgi:hypothetical protein